jgi:hypothetical protein
MHSKAGGGVIFGDAGMRWLLVLAGLGLSFIGAVDARADQGQPPAATGLDELARLNAQILKSPADVALNLQYASVAESLGLTRLALAAYERILMADPHNQAAQAGIDRVREALQPNTTRFFLETGYIWESDPRYTQIDSTHGRDQLLADLNVVDERTIDDLRWRTVGDSSLRYYAGSDASDLDYGRIGAVTGPVLQMQPGLTFNPGLGVGGAYFDHRWFYAEVSANATFSIYPEGAEQSLTLRGAYRDYNHAFYPGTQGGYADAIGKITLPEIFQDTAIGFVPWFRVSEISGGVGTAIVPLTTDIQPGDYLELGGKVQAYHSLTDYLILGGSFSVGGRFYESVEVPLSAERRKDVTLSPGVQIVIPHLIAYQNDLRIGYQYTWNHSNVNTDTYKDHVFRVSLATRF